MVDWDINLTLNLMSVDIDHEVIEEEEGIAFGESEAAVLSHGELADTLIHQRHILPPLDRRGRRRRAYWPRASFAVRHPPDQPSCASSLL